MKISQKMDDDCKMNEILPNLRKMWLTSTVIVCKPHFHSVNKKSATKRAHLMALTSFSKVFHGKMQTFWTKITHFMALKTNDWVSHWPCQPPNLLAI